MTQKNATLDLISYDCGWGCGDYGCQDGPEKADLSGLSEALRGAGYNTILSDLKLRELGDRSQYKTKYETYPMTVQSVTKLAERCANDIKSEVVPVVIGGDHSSAIGTWSGVISALGAHKKFGLIWIDAHMDAHTPETSNEGKWGGWWHGMPVAALTGQGDNAFRHLMDQDQKINPKHITLMGIRSFEPGEEAYVEQNEIYCYKARDVHTVGFEAALKESIEYIEKECDFFGVSIDLDGFDPEDAPGVGTPEKYGIKASEAVPALRGISQHPKFKGLEVVEYNPHNGEDGITRGLIHDLVNEIFAKD